MACKIYKAIYSFFLVTFFSVSGFSQNYQLNSNQFIDLEQVLIKNGNIMLNKESSQFEKPVLKIKPDDNNSKIVIWEKDDEFMWDNHKYLIIEIFGNNEFSGIINIEFYKENDELGIYTLMGLMPKLKTKMVFPLSYLDGQNVFLPRFPRQLKGTVWGRRLAPGDITKVALKFGPVGKAYPNPEFEIASITLSDDLPEAYPPLEEPLIDEFGQWKGKKWKGKIRNHSQLVRKNHKLEKKAVSAEYPDNWSKYGGWKKKQFEKTGFFRTHHDGERWWLVDPEGYAFLSTGVNVMHFGSPGPVDGIEDLFDTLPVKSKNVDFYVKNLKSVYGEEAKSKWELIAGGMMKEFRFNTVANWSDLNFAKSRKLPYVLPLSGFPTTQIRLFRDFPDVFSEEYEKNSVRFAQQLIPYSDDSYLIGYFLQNEPEWASEIHNIALEMFGTNQISDTKKVFAKWLRDKYNNDITALNIKWQLDLKDFNDILNKTYKSSPSEIANKDFYEFSEIMVAKYVDIPCDEIIKIDKNHLNMGMRYAWLSSDLLYKAGERFDVFSINGYGIEPPATAEIAQKSGKPVMIGEFHYGATDRGLPSTGIVAAANQKERGSAYRYYIEKGFSRPEVVGMHYFQWTDQPFYGRFDGENYNIGVVDINNTPYTEMIRAMTVSNGRIYQVASGKLNSFKRKIEKIPAIHF